MNTPRAQRQHMANRIRSFRVDRMAQSTLALAMRRPSGIALFAFSVIVFAVNLPPQITYWRLQVRLALFGAAPYNHATIGVLHTLGITEPRFVTINIVLLVTAALASFVVSGLILWRRVADHMAMLAAVMLLAVGVVGPSTLPGAFDALASFWLWHLMSQCLIFIAVLSFPLFFILFPSGSFVPRWTRWLLVGVVPLAFTYAFFPHLLFSEALSAFRSALVAGISLCLGYAQIYRYQRISNPIERQQTKWVSLGVIGGLTINSLQNILPWLLSPLHVAPATYALIFAPIVTMFILLGPVYVGIAIMRFRLWSIDVIIRRTLIYGTLTGILAAFYFSMIVGAQAITQRLTGQTGQEPLVIVVTTLLIAALVAPLRRWIQALIDRAFYRSTYDAAITLSEFGAKLRSEIELAELREALETVVQETMQPTHISLWLRRRPGQSHGSPGK